MHHLIKILHLEDNQSDSILVQSILKRADVNFEYHLVDSEAAFQSNLEEGDFDLILSDFHLPDYSGSEALLYSRMNFPTIPFIFLSGTMGEDVAIESLLNGATDYVLKNKMERLVPAIRRAFKETQVQKAKLKAESALLQSEQNFRQSISGSPLGIRIVNSAGDTIYANEAFLNIFEFSSLEEFNKTPARDWYTEKSYLEHLERKELRKQGNEALEYELAIMRRNKEIRHVKIIRNEVLWNGIKHFQVINQDITEQKRLTAELIAAKEKAEESDRLKSAFLANMSHEIRTPMNGILGFSSLLSEPGLDGEDRVKYIGLIQKSGKRMLNILNEIVDMSKIEAGLMELNLKVTNINDQLEHIFNLFKSEAQLKKIRLSCNINLPSSEVNALVDKDKLDSILMNIVKNAVKYTDEGSIEIGCDVVETTHALSLLQFYVKDTGIGIPLDRQEAIFERFIQADIEDTQARQGSGLGLTISKAYVEMMNGRIWVESRPGEGSVFYFTIPYIPESPIMDEIGNETNAPVEDSKIKLLNILIVEDDETSSKMLSVFVRKISNQIYLCESGEQAIECMLNHPDIDLILMDIRMPGISGYEATEKIRAFNKEVIIIAQTAFGLSGDRDKSISAGCNDWVSKPVSKGRLFELIKKFF